MKHFISLKPLDSSRALFSPSPVFLHCVLLHYWVGNNTNLIPKLARGEDQDKSRMSTLTVLAQQKMFLPWGVLFLNGCCTQRVSLLVPFSLWQAGFRGKLPHKKKKKNLEPQRHLGVSESSWRNLRKDWGAASFEQGRWRPQTLESGVLLSKIKRQAELFLWKKLITISAKAKQIMYLDKKTLQFLTFSVRQNSQY